MKLNLLFLTIGLVVIILFNVWACKHLDEQKYSTTFEKVTYVGIHACKKCHEEIYNDYIQTGMGRSFYRPDVNNIIEDFSHDKSIVYDSYGNYYYQPYWQQNALYIKEFRLEGHDTAYMRTEKMDYIVGSGNATRSYLIERNGYLYEAPITWYVLRKKWDLSPGYEEGKNSRFSRAVGKECMSCHNGHFEFEEGTINRYKKLPLGIDCESCHGAGSEHVSKMEAGDEVDVSKKIDYSIVNPRKLSVDRSFDICQQCHLQGTFVYKGTGIFRPSEQLDQSKTVFIPIKKDLKSFSISSHAERLRLSACFLKSGNKLTCISCHNPHKSIHKTDPQIFNKNCAQCHQPSACTEKNHTKQNVNNNCVHCHLPKGGTSDIPHVRFTDHYIRIVGKEIPNHPQPVAQSAYLSFLCATSNIPNDDLIGKAYLTYYEQNTANPEFLKIALDKLAPGSHYERAKTYFFSGDHEKSLIEINLFLENNPQNTWALFLKGEVLEYKKNFQASYDCYFKAFEINPYLSEAGVKASVMLLQAHPSQQSVLDASMKILKRVIAVKPHDVPALVNLGFIYMNQNRLSDAMNYLQKALTYEPDHPTAKQNIALINSKMNRGR